MKDTRHRHLGALSVLLLDPDQLARPVTHVQVSNQ